jgi:hypothetical protein
VDVKQRKDLPTLRVSEEYYARLRLFADKHQLSLRTAAEAAIDVLLHAPDGQPSGPRPPPALAFPEIWRAKGKLSADLEAKLVGVVERIEDPEIRSRVLLDLYVTLR